MNLYHQMLNVDKGSWVEYALSRSKVHLSQQFANNACFRLLLNLEEGNSITNGTLRHELIMACLADSTLVPTARSGLTWMKKATLDTDTCEETTRKMLNTYFKTSNTYTAALA